MSLLNSLLSSLSGSVDSVFGRTGAVTAQNGDYSVGQITGAEATANKDANGGYVGLTLFKINFKNVANTFTSFFTNTNTAARTYTFQDRNGTIADDTDLALKANAASPIFTGTTTLSGGQKINTRVVTAAGAITITSADYLVVVNKASGAATVVNLPAGVTNTVFIIKDGKGDALVNNITLTPASGNIDGSSTYVLNTNYSSATIVYNGTEWSII